MDIGLVTYHPLESKNHELNGHLLPHLENISFK